MPRKSPPQRTLADLEEYLDAIDLCYFDRHLADMNVVVSWLPPRRPLELELVANYVHETKVIGVSRNLAWSWVPRVYVMQTIFHEGLHAILGPAHDSHTKTFYLAERQFVFAFEARQWERDNRRKLVRSREPKRVL